jgi:membrane-associated phospholipid phosphatase
VIRVAARLVALPASAWPSLVLLVVLAAFAWRRRGAVCAVVFVACFGLAGAAEVVSKSAVERPALYVERVSGIHHLAGFDSSYPSGHAVRAVVLVFLAASLWPSVRSLLLAWTGVALILVELGGFHTPSDIVGGCALGAAIVALAAALHQLGCQGPELGASGKPGPDSDQLDEATVSVT